MSYGYVEVGLCGRCGLPNHLFATSDNVAEQSLMCIPCHNRFADTRIEPVEIMAETFNCEACGRPEFAEDSNWEFRLAYLGDKETEITVHKDCTTLGRISNTCNDCSTVYATSRNVDWRSGTDTSLFMQFTMCGGQTRCNNCADIYFADSGGRHLFTECESCCDNFYTHLGRRFNRTLYCRTCYDNYVYECDDCGITYWEDDGHDCEPDEDEDDNTIHSYSYRPSPYFFGTGQYHLGFELEVEARNSSRYQGAEIAQTELGGHAYMKDDGSLSDGFEIVTHPHTLSDYQTAFNWDFIPKLKSEGFRSWNTETCGLHVHVSRTAFGTGEISWGRADREQLILKKQAHELRFMKLIYDNQRQVERIAGRSNNHYATFGDKGKLVEKIKFGNQSNGRYSAINTDNDATLEVRVFKGSLRKERVLSALEFVAASVEYTRNLKVTSRNQALTWLRFTAYVSDNLETYPNLALIMSESFASDLTPNEN